MLFGIDLGSIGWLKRRQPHSFIPPIQGIDRKCMANRLEVDANLMHTTCGRSHLQQSKTTKTFEDRIAC